MSFIRKIKKLPLLREAFAAVALKKFPLNPVVGNPQTRAEIPGDFPPALSPYDPAAGFELIRQALAREGVTPEEAGTIHLAYPHKHSGLHPHHENKAESSVMAFRDRMQSVAPQVHWSVAGALCERLHLGRSENQTSLYALTAKQVYDVYAPAQKEASPFDPARKKPEFFIIVDTVIEQGTTVANMMSFIRHNGGKVLMIAGDRRAAIAQKAEQYANQNFPQLSAPFNDAARNTARLPQMAKAFAGSAERAGFSWSPDECMHRFEDALQSCGNSVFALTDGECKKIIGTVNGATVHAQSFPAMLAALEQQGCKERQASRKSTPRRKAPVR
jgi:hypothetical protein